MDNLHSDDSGDTLWKLPGWDEQDMLEEHPAEDPEKRVSEPDPTEETHARRSGRIGDMARYIGVALVAGAAGAVLSGVSAPATAGGVPGSVAEMGREVTVTVVLPDGRNGSGVVLGDDGYIVSNAHVVGDEATVRIYDHTGREQEALVVGKDDVSDIAVLRAGGTMMRGIEIRDLDERPMRIGEPVIAVGSPFGFEGSVTAGVISGDRRSLRMSPSDILTGLLQTDAAINPGNSGGPIIDGEGMLVGVSTAIASSSGLNQGFGFAVPADVVAKVVEAIVEEGEVRYASLGVRVLDFPGRGGAEVQSLVEGGPSEAAGMQAGDIIISIDAAPVTRVSDLISYMRRMSPGDTVLVRVRREGSTITLPVKLTEAS